ncbi:ABC transporter ATP-binding protein [Halorussus salinisoli]|uniref:ABC transporter ATP-binding protein n=1 Tax=Halorussus salinisoli TaxID=2558242 RepID=UPI0010C1A115|nr:ABC transporter ATP-binding protein [Halorussus salinisoli]
MTDPVLRAENLRKSFGGLVAVDDVSFAVEESTIVGLIGPNGAGKSTTFNLLSGFHELDDGEVIFEGERVGGLSPHERAQRGMVRTFQITRELTGMRVMANMLLAAQDHPGEKVLSALVNTDSVDSREERARERAEDLLKFLELWELRDEYAGNLSGGQRKLLELGRALMADPDVLLLDEPVAGVNPDLTDRLLARIDDLQSERGMTFVIVEHDMDVIMSISDKVVGMHNGEVLSVGTPEEVKRDDRMLEAYLGGAV